ncbi:hydroxymyristoyl-ACP dehydratase, partial [Escherichia coli]|nr:hydroxymyristoyl-ACP dehydratase [Escherichia coli]
APLIPETTVTLQLTWQETSQVLTFCYQRHDGDARHTASSGKIRLCR